MFRPSNSRQRREMIQDLLNRPIEEVMDEYDIQVGQNQVIDNVTFKTFASYQAWVTHIVDETLGDDSDDVPSIRSMRRYDD